MNSSQPYDPFDLVGQDEAKAKAKEREKLEAKLESEDLKWVMSSKRGRRFMWKLLSKAGVYRTSFTGDSVSTCFNEGMRNVGLYLLGAIHSSSPDQYNQMVKESKHGNSRISDDRNGEQ